MSTYKIDKFKAVLESGIDIEESGLSGIINLTYSLDKYEIMSDISDEYDLGYYWVHDSGVYDIKAWIRLLIISTCRPVFPSSKSTGILVSLFFCCD